MVRPKRSTTVGEDELYLCDQPDCGKRFKKYLNFESHQLLHSGARPFKCEMEGCAASYTRNQHLTRHISKSHKKEAGFYRCKADNCVASFDTNESLCQHFRRAHYGSKSNTTVAVPALKCEHCNKEFPSISKLQLHLVSTHEFKCGDCGRIFTQESDFSKHVARHEREKNKNSMNCKLCNLEFQNWDELTEHKRTEGHIEHQQIALTCSTCGLTFKDQRNFNLHVQIHNTDREIFRCTEGNGCEKSYYFLKNLRHHIRTVHQTGTYVPPKCSLCDKVFSTKHRLESHKKRFHDPGCAIKKTIMPRQKVVDQLSGDQGLSARALLKAKRPVGSLIASRKKRKHYENSQVSECFATQFKEDVIEGKLELVQHEVATVPLEM